MKRLFLFTIGLILAFKMFAQEFSSLTVDGKAIIKEIPENVLFSKTRGLNIEEETEYQNNSRKRIGYKGTVNLSIECPFSDKVLSTVMETIKKNPFQFTYVVNFVFSEKQKQEIINYAVEKSIADAKIKAEIIAKASNLDLISIKSIVYSKDYFSYQPESDVISLVDQRIQFNTPLMMMMPPTDEMTINQEEFAVEKIVKVEWNTKPK